MLLFIIALLLLSNCNSSRITKKPPITAIDTAIKEDTQYYYLTMNYPQFINGPSQLNIDIEKYINTELENFKKDAIERYKNTEYLRKNNEHQSISNIEIKYKIAQVSNSYISLAFSTCCYHAYCARLSFDHNSFNCDVKKNKYISLADLFPSKFNFAEKLCILARKKVLDMTTVSNDPDNDFYLDENDYNTNQNGINSAPFTFTDNTINLYFDWPCFHIGEISFSRDEIKI